MKYILIQCCLNVLLTISKKYFYIIVERYYLDFNDWPGKYYANIFCNISPKIISILLKYLLFPDRCAIHLIREKACLYINVYLHLYYIETCGILLAI